MKAVLDTITLEKGRIQGVLETINDLLDTERTLGVGMIRTRISQILQKVHNDSRKLSTIINSQKKED